MKRSWIAGGSAVAVAFVPFVFSGQVAQAAPPTMTSVIVRLAGGTNAAAVAADAARGGGKVSFTYRNVFPGFAARLPAQAINALRNNPAVLTIEIDATATRADTQTGATWGLDRIDQPALPLDGTFTYPTVTNTVTSYVVDTGVLASHTEFGGRVNSGFTSVSDGNGTSDCNGHGTHVSGTVAGTTYGVAKTARIVPVRVLGCDGSGSYSGVIAGLDWIAADHAAGVPAVANLSLGGPASSTLDTAIQRVIDDGVTVVVAAGNSNTDACTTSPARVPAALTVAASNSSDWRASFSNYGTCVDIFAPGVNITSAWSSSTSATAVLQGTSMASPHATGAVALLLGQTPSLTPAQVVSTLTGQSTLDVVRDAGAGTPNRLLRAVSVGGPAPTAPTAPTGVAAAAGRRSATVIWTQGSDGGSSLTRQTVYVYVGTRQAASYAVPVTATSARVTNLKAGISYTFKVLVANAYGSAWSAASNAVTPTR